eukprot:jgi/Psemu1/188011/e_gw1.73.95.1
MCDGHDHDHEHSDDLGLSLRPQIDFDGVTCLNEELPNMGRSVLKLHEERLTPDPFLRSQEDDPELLLYVPFTEAVTVTHLSIRCTPRTFDGDYPSAAPRTVKVFSDRDNIDFEMARDLTPQCTVDVAPPDHFVEGTVDYPLRPAGRFQNISSLTVFVADNFAAGLLDGDGDEVATIVTYIGIKGRGSRQKRMVVDAVYETRGMKKDHQVPGADFGTQNEIG